MDLWIESKRSGKAELVAPEIYLPLSMELHWFSIQESKNIIQIALQKKLLKKKGELLTPTFNLLDFNIPIGFSPSKQLLEGLNEIKSEEDIKEKNEDLLKRIIKKIKENTDSNIEKIEENIKNINIEKNLILEVAALIECREYNIDINEFYDELEQIFFKDKIE